jgi:hypothetical protein
MNGTFKTSSQAPRRRRSAGLTLVEVVAGLALLSTLLVAVLTTKARVTRQWANAQRRLDATAAADRLLATWWQDVERFPRQSSGRVAGDGQLRWRTRPVRNDSVESLGASVVRLEVTGGSDEMLAAVEVVLSNDPPARREMILGDAR